MEGLLKSVEALKNSQVKTLVHARINEFKELGKKPSNEIFNELCFCILTANFNAERSVKIQNELGNGFCDLSEQQLIEKLKALGHRFPETRGKYIVEARKHKDSLKYRIKSFKQETELRDWLVKKVKGLGYKEASHFLRNIGFMNLAIIDFHIVDVLIKHGLIVRPKTLTPKKYLEIEDVLKGIARKTNLTLAELDLYLWYMETGKVLK
jgi:N-glycosylase/DNA lyase